MRRLLLAAFVFLAAQVSAFAQERIVSFISDVQVLQNGDLDVTETITIQAEGNQFRRGIFRDFPTSYRRRSDGTNVIVGFDVISVTRNGQPENYTTESVSNGVRTRIGRADVTISRGQHVSPFHAASTSMRSAIARRGRSASSTPSMSFTGTRPAMAGISRSILRKHGSRCRKARRSGRTRSTPGRKGPREKMRALWSRAPIASSGVPRGGWLPMKV